MADRRVQVERELLKISGEINDLKKKGAALTEAELKLLQKKRLEERSLKKEQAKHYKEQEENLLRQSGLTSKLEQLQDKIGKIYKHNNNLVVETNAEFYKSGLHLTKNLTLTGAISDSIIKSVRPLEMVVDQLYNAADATKAAEAALEGVQDKSEDMSSGFEMYKKEVGVGGKKLKEWVRENADGTKTVGMAWQDASKLFTQEPDTKTMQDFESWANRISEDFNVANQAGATMMETLADGLTTNVGNAIALQENFLSIGGPNFTNMTSEMEKQAKITEYQVAGLKQQRSQQQDRIKGIIEQMKGVDKTSTLYKTMNEQKEELQKQVTKIAKAEGELTETAETNLKLAREQAIASDQITGATEAIMAPFEKIKGLIVSMPMGGLISKTIGLETHMGEFGGTVNDAMEGFQKGSLDVNGAMDMIRGGSQKMIQGLVSGLKQVGSMLMANPMMIMVVAIMAVGMALKKVFGGFTELRKEMGLTFGAAAELQSNINITAARFKFMGVSAEDVKGVVGGIQENWGGVGQATEENISLLTGLNAEFGISGEHSSKLVTQMMAVGSVSREAAAAQLESVGNLARASGVAPAAIMADVAESTEFFAGFAKDGGDNMFKTAIAAKKLGLNLGTAEKIAESLLDFESSIEAQMEASMMTGRAINTDRARELMLAGDTEGMMKEVTKQIGSQADWNAMNIAQRKSLAKAFGMEVSEVGKMMAEQARRANMTQAEIDAEEERAKKQEESGKIMSDIMMFLGDLWAEILIAAKNLWPVIKGIGIALAIAFAPVTLVVAGVMVLIWAFNKLSEIFPGIGTALTVISAILAGMWLYSKNIGMSFSNMIPSLGKLTGKLKGMTGTLKDKAKEKMGAVKDKAKEKMGAAVDKVTGKGTKDKTKAVKKPKTSKSKGGRKGGKGGFGFMEKIDGKKMIQGAAALLIAAAAMWVAAKALQEFGKVTWPAIAKAGVTLLGLTVVLGILGQLKGQLIQGAVAMLIMSVALIPFAFALQMFTGIDFKQVALGGVAMIGFAVAMGLLGMAAPAIIFGSVAMAIMSVALIPFAFALQMFTGIDFKQVKLGGITMLGLGTALAGLGLMAPLIIAGSWAVGIMSIALMGLGVALILIGTGMKLFQGSVSSIVEPLTQLASIVSPLLLLAGAFTALGISMGAMAIGALTLLPALPVLFALNKLGLLGGVSLGGGGEEESSKSEGRNPVEEQLMQTNTKLEELIGVMSQTPGLLTETNRNLGTISEAVQ